MTTAPLLRREFLLQALGACCAPLVAGRGYGVQASLAVQAGSARAAVGARRGVSYLGQGSVQAAQAIGRARLRALGVGESREAIAAAVGGTLDLIDSAPDEQAALKALADAVRRDFVERRSIEVEGWILSPTEVDLCILTLLPLPA